MILTIVVATHNRPTELARCLTSIRPQLALGAELITFKNDTGLAKARNLGWQKAKGEYVAYIDDDAVATVDWVAKILAFIKVHPDVAIFGGPYTSLNQAEIPAWIPPELTSKVLSATSPRPIKLGIEWLSGTNFVVKKSALARVGGFNENLGVKGHKRAYGEETDLQIRLHNLGYEVWYDPAISVEHEFAAFKMNLGYLLRNQFVNGHNSRDVFRYLRTTNRRHTTQTIFARVAEVHIPPLRRLYYLLAPFYYLAGMLSARLR